ncbi:MAG: NAD-dependent epimerase/dehydratase [Rhodospirillales bacterium]|jgi:CDP-paratose 2-epimerase|nr:NAD-dependent epimerase/dehydratase [Rhodospirillales bacterium]
MTTHADGAERAGRNPLRRLAEGPVLITGGAGFVGANLAHRLAQSGRSVVVYDNLSRPGVEQNLAWLRMTHPDRVSAEIADVLDTAALTRAVRSVSQIFHFAAQVAVTTGMLDPRKDFAVNATGTLNLLEAVRSCASPPPLVYTSTNKVYGAVDDLPLETSDARYDLAAQHGSRGIDENRPLDFHTPYGCSKGAADQYVLDYARSYGLSTVVFRMSCIYGPHQFGTEDQGWVAHFLLRALAGKSVTVYGDGRQVRDILYVDDLIDAFLTAQRAMPRLRGQAFNIGGGRENSISLLELIDRIGKLRGQRPEFERRGWRQGDQRYYVSDYARFSGATGWRPRVPAAEGIARLHAWLRDNLIREPGRIPTRQPSVALEKAPAIARAMQ